MTKLTRRRLLAGALSGGSVLSLTGLAACLQSRPSLPEPQSRRSLTAPVDFAGGRLIAEPAQLELRSGSKQDGYGYNGMIPGPTVRVRRGDRFSVRTDNGLREPTTVHWHGLIPPPEMDGHPSDAFGPGESRLVDFPVDQRASLNWYHPHPHHATAEQVWLGLAGLFVIEDAEEDALGLPAGDAETLIVLRDGRISPSGNFNHRSSGLGDFPIGNGVPWPQREVARSLHRLRILNGANRRVFELELGVPATLIGNDGGLLERAEAISRLTLGPAERVDLIVDFSGLNPGTVTALRCRDTAWSLVEFITSQREGRSRGRPQTAVLSRIEPLVHDGEPDRVFRFEGHARINGLMFEMDRIDFVVPFGRTERWRFESRGGAPHPIHVHGAHFQVIERRGGRNRVFAWERGWKDTVLLQEGEAVDVLIRFDAYEGRYLLHCHRLEHEDHGMMMNFLVSQAPERDQARVDVENLFGPICWSDDRV